MYVCVHVWCLFLFIDVVELMNLCTVCDIDRNKLWEIADLQGVYRQITAEKFHFVIFMLGYFSVS